MPFSLPDHDVMIMLGKAVAKQRIENTRQFHIETRKQYSQRSMMKLMVSTDVPELEAKYEKYWYDCIDRVVCVKQIKSMIKDRARGANVEPSFFLYCKGQDWDKGNWGVY